MKQLLAILGCLLLCAPVQADLADLGFLSGNWESSGEQTVQESWSYADGNELLGYSKTIGEGKLLFFEFLRIYETKDGVFYQPYIRGSKGALFRMQQLEEDFVKFTNPDNEFPKVIEYRREADRLFIKLSGGETPVNLTLKLVK